MIDELLRSHIRSQVSTHQPIADEVNGRAIKTFRYCQERRNCDCRPISLRMDKAIDQVVHGGV